MRLSKTIIAIDFDKQMWIGGICKFIIEYRQQWKPLSTHFMWCLFYASLHRRIVVILFRPNKDCGVEDMKRVVVAKAERSTCQRKHVKSKSRSPFQFWKVI